MSSNSPISFPGHGNTVDSDMLPDGVIPDLPVTGLGSRKRKQAFSMNDPDNAELARLATQAAMKKTKLSKANSSGKDSKITHQKKSAGPKSNQRQPSNSKNVSNESEAGDRDDDDEAATAEATKKKNLSKPTPSQNKKNKKKTNKKAVPKQNRQPTVEDVTDEDDVTDNNLENVVDVENNSGSDDDDVEVVEKPAESAEEELS